MEGFIVIVGTGLVLVVLGVLLLKKERHTFSNSITTKAKVVTYYDYINYDSSVPVLMYTMAAEYMDSNGNLIHAREQSSATQQKYKVGTDISVTYSHDKPDFFVMAGDQSRYIIFYGMIIVGLLMIFVLGTALLQKR